MEFVLNAVTDAGIKKKTNQDSMTIKVAKYNGEQIVFAVLCDGMGGLSKGELASATVISEFSQWFSVEFPKMLEEGCEPKHICDVWKNMLVELNERLIEYGKAEYTNLGTTVVALLIMKDKYIIANVGDSRAYMLDRGIFQLTKDQSLIAREIENGRITEEQAKDDPRKNVLLQCVGATKNIEPDFYMGSISSGMAVLLCSDGFRHQVTSSEIFMELNPKNITNSQDIASKIRKLVDLNKERQETDNITAGLIKVV